MAKLCALPSETDWIEFKKNRFDAENVGKYVSGLANAAMFEQQQYAYMVWGIEDGTMKWSVRVLGSLRKLSVPSRFSCG